MENKFSTGSERQIDVRTEQMGIKSYQALYLTKVYNWMALALVLTGIVAYITATTPGMIGAIAGSKLLFYGLIIGELLLVVYLTSAIRRMSQKMAITAFLVYSVLNGLTLSIIFLVYTSSSISTTFFVTAGTFAAMSFYGYTTKKDLTSIGNLAFMALIGIILASIVNFFMKSEMLYWIVTYLGVAIFVGLTAYDTQKLKEIGSRGFTSEENMEKMSIMGALTLYLDFINLFLFLLRILGDRK